MAQIPNKHIIVKTIFQRVKSLSLPRPCIFYALPSLVKMEDWKPEGGGVPSPFCSGAERGMSVTEQLTQFQSEEECHEHLAHLRWPGGVRCLRCGSSRIRRIARRRQYECRACKYRFSAMVGTIFESSHIPLKIWFPAIHRICESKSRVSAHQLHKELGITYKSAWLMVRRIRENMRLSHESDTARIGEACVGEGALRFLVTVNTGLTFTKIHKPP